MDNSDTGTVNKVSAIVRDLLALSSVLIGLWAMFIAQPHSGSDSGCCRLNAIFFISILAVIGYNVLWRLAEKVWAWNFGAGGSGTLPSGWSAVILSLSVTLPLVFIPPVYQAITGAKVAPPLHWKASWFMVGLGIISHLIMYGTPEEKGIRQRMHAPTGEYPNFNIALSLELIYSVVYFGLIVLPYRYIVSNDESKTTLLLWRTALPAVTYFFWMIAFVLLRYPASLHDRTWIQVRGFYAGIIMMFCFCAGMFL